MNNELNQIVKVLSDIKKELHIQNIIAAAQYLHPNGALYSKNYGGVEDFFEKLLKGIENET